MTQFRAILCALAAFFSWVVVDVIIKLSSQNAMSPFLIMAILGSVGAASLFGSALVKRDISVLRPRSWREQAVTCVCAVIMNDATIIALKHLPLTIFYIVVFTAPMAISLLSAFVKQEVLTPVKILCLIAGFSGVVLATATHISDSGEWIGYAAALASVAGFAVYAVTLRKIASTDTAQSTQLLNALSVGVFGLTGSWQITALPDSRALLLMIAAGIVNILANILYNQAMNHTSASNVAQIHYSQIVSGSILGFLIWHEMPTWNLIMGSIIIIASGMIVAAQAHQAETEPFTQPH